jgi:hypothetical protein
VTYYKIWKYLVKRGLTDDQAHYVRNMIRQLLKEDKCKSKQAQDFLTKLET